MASQSLPKFGELVSAQPSLGAGFAQWGMIMSAIVSANVIWAEKAGLRLNYFVAAIGKRRSARLERAGDPSVNRNCGGRLVGKHSEGPLWRGLPGPANGPKPKDAGFLRIDGPEMRLNSTGGRNACVRRRGAVLL